MTLPRPAFAPFVADTGAEAPPILLTQKLVTPYVVVEAELNTYWQVHRDLMKQLLRQHAREHDVLSSTQGVAGTFLVMDYAAVVQLDTAAAAIFKRHQFAPAQFAPIQVAVLNAITTLFAGQAANTTTIAGKNMAFVQAHRQNLATDWQLGRALANSGKQTIQRIQQQMEQQAAPQGSTQQGDLTP